jgi:hypothetical protein
MHFLPELWDWIDERVTLRRLKWQNRKADPRVRALVILMHKHPGLTQKSEYDRLMENHFARHPRTRTTTRPTPYRRGVNV